MTADTYFKVLDAGRVPCNGGSGQWPEPGVWREVDGPIEECGNGLHLCRGTRQLLDWLGPVIWRAEVEGDVVNGGDKVVVRRARLVEVTPWCGRVARLFAVDCAEHVLEDKHPGDTRPRDAIAVARRYAVGDATEDQLDAAKRAAWAAAGVATRAAWAAAGAAAGEDASPATRAAGAAAAAAWDAAWNAERDWQADRLNHYLTGETT